MAPCTEKEDELITCEGSIEKLIAPQANKRKHQIVYMNLFTFGYWYIAGLYGLYLFFTSTKWSTIILNIFLIIASGLGITVGAHRLWAHKCFKAKLPLQIILMILNTLAFQNTAITWVRDHRMHHKFTDTDADPHNATRGFFFSHVGWLLVKKHPELMKRSKHIDMSDIYGNPVLTFQKKYAFPLVATFTFILPTVVPIYFWDESLNNAWHATVFRYAYNLNITFLVNSAAHMWGYRPYDKNIQPTQNIFTTLCTFGEGFHNYHHTFPWDYRAAELGNNYLNLSTKVIDFFAWIGWAYDLKTVPADIVNSRAKRTGDGTDLWGGNHKHTLDEKENRELDDYVHKSAF